MSYQPMPSRLGAMILALSLLIVPAIHAAGIGGRESANPRQQAPDTAEDHIKKGNAAYQAKDYKLARDEARAALKLNEKSPEANLLLALTYKRLNKASDSMKYAKRAAQYRPAYADAHYLLAVLSYEQGRLKESGDELARAMQQGAQFANAYVLKGTLEIIADKRADALASYKEALRQAGPDAAAMTSIQQRVTALESIEEFVSHKDDPAYHWPKPLNAPMPHYTEEARSNRVQGAVLAAVLVDETGKVTTVVLLTTLGYGLDEEAVRAASRLKFMPAIKDGKPAPTWQRVTIEFNLR
jgi:TonB family protein